MQDVNNKINCGGKRGTLCTFLHHNKKQELLPEKNCCLGTIYEKGWKYRVKGKSSAFEVKAPARKHRLPYRPGLHSLR